MSINQINDGELLSDVRGKLNATITKVNSVEEGAQVNVGTNLGQGGSGNSRTITSSTGSSVTVSTATTTNAGFMSTGDKSKLDGIQAGAQVNVATNLTYTSAASTGTVNSSTGTNATIPAATTSVAGLLTGADKTKLDGIQAGAQVNVATNLGSSGTGATRTITSSTGSNTSITYSASDVGAPTTTGSGASGTWGISVTGNAGTATTLQTARSINGTNFNGSGNITTANWGTARTLTIGSTGKSVNGSGNVSWSLSEIGALPLAGGTSTGQITARELGVSNTSNSSGKGISLYNGSTTGQPTYGLMFGGTATFGTYGGVSADWATYFTMNNTANRGWIFKTSTGTAGNVASINTAGTATFAGDVNSASDERLKTNWRNTQPDLLDKLLSVKSGIYDRTDSGITQAGVSAQDWREVLPETVSEDSEGMLSVNYGNAALVTAIELAKEVVMLRSRIEQLEAKVGGY